MPDSSPSRFARFKRMQFSLRTMLIVMTVLILLLVFWVIPSERQRIAVNQIEKLGGKIKLSGADIKDWPYATSTTVQTHWYSNYFATVESIYFDQKNITGINWGYLPKLRALRFHGDHISDIDARIIGQLKELEKLSIVGCVISDEALYNITRQNSLSELEIFGAKQDLTSPFMSIKYVIQTRDLSKLNDSQPSWLLDLKKLQYLSIKSCDIDQKIFDKITAMKNLKTLCIAGTNLNKLDYDKVPMGEIDTSHFSRLDNLEELDISSIIISDASIENMMHLPKLKNLKMSFLDLHAKNISMIAQLRSLEKIEYENWIGYFRPEMLVAFAKLPKLKVMKVQISGPASSNTQLMIDEYQKIKQEVSNLSSTIKIETPYDNFTTQQ